MPPLHPLVVHIPIGILLLAVVLEVVALCTKRAELSSFGWWAQILGSAGLVAAVLTGLLAERAASISPGARNTFENHEQLAFLTTSLFCVLLLWRIASRGKIPPSAPRLFVLLLAAGIAALLTTAWFGGELVYRFGTGLHLP